MRKLLFILALFACCTVSLRAQTIICGGQDDGHGHIPSDLVNGANDWATFTPPTTVGGTYVDQLGVALGGTGCTVKRLTVGGDTAHYYSTTTAMSVGDTYIFVAGSGTCGPIGGWCVIDKNGNVIIDNAHMPPGLSRLYVWDATVDGKFYYSNGNTLGAATILGTNSLSLSTVFTFTQYTEVGIPDEGRVSWDGSSIALMGEHPGASSIPIDVFSFNLNTLTQGLVWTSSASGNCTYAAQTSPIGGADSGTGTGGDGCLHKILMGADNEPQIEFHANTDPSNPAGCVTAYSSGFSCITKVQSGGNLTAVETGTTHDDSFLSLTGNNPMYLFLWFASPNGTQTDDPCPGHGGHTAVEDVTLTASCIFTTMFTGGHISTSGTGPLGGGAGGMGNPWALISYDDTSRSHSPEWYANAANYTAPTSTAPATSTCSQYNTAGSALAGNCWFPYESEGILVNMASTGNTGGLGGTAGDVYRMYWSRTRDQSTPFWGTQRASISRDGKYIVFDSNMAYAALGNCAHPTDLGCADVYLVGPIMSYGSAPAVSLSPGSLSFGNQNVSTISAQQIVTLTNTGTATLTISSVALTTGTQFALAPPGVGSDCRTVGTVAAGSSCNIAVTFTPTSAGAKSDTVSVTDNASGSPQTFGVSGTGITSSPTVAPVAVMFSGNFKFSGAAMDACRFTCIENQN